MSAVKNFIGTVGASAIALASCTGGGSDTQSYGTDSCARSFDQDFALNVTTTDQPDLWYSGRAIFDYDILFSQPNVLNEINLVSVEARFHEDTPEELRDAVIEKEIDCHVEVLEWYKHLQQSQGMSLPFQSYAEFLVFWDGLAFLLLNQEDQSAIMRKYKEDFPGNEALFTFDTIDLPEDLPVNAFDIGAYGLIPGSATHQSLVLVTNQILRLATLGFISESGENVSAFIEFMQRTGIDVFDLPEIIISEQ